MTAPTIDRAMVTQVERDIVDVCRTLTTRKTEKKHGAYLYYEDDRITVSLDSYHPNMAVYVGLDCVFSRGGGGGGVMSIFRPGHWVNYLHQLGERAREQQRAAAVLETEAAEAGGALEARRQQLERRRAEHEEMRLTLARRLMGSIIAEDVYQRLEAAEVQAIKVIDAALADLPPAPPVVNLRARLDAIAAVDRPALDLSEWREVLIALAERVIVDGPRSFRLVWRPEAEFVRQVVANVSTTHPPQQ